jgi:hypothetical protein
MDNPEIELPRRSLLSSPPSAIRLGSVDTCRIRLLSLRTRIETDWPSAGGLLRRGPGLSRASEAAITDLLVGLPTPLPLNPGGTPEAIFAHDDTELCTVAGRAVDAALTLLEAGALDAIYEGQVCMLESNRPEAPQPIVVENPSVGLLVATIIGTLEAVSEHLMKPGKPAAPPAAPPAPKPADDSRPGTRRARVVPRI